MPTCNPEPFDNLSQPLWSLPCFALGWLAFTCGVPGGRPASGMAHAPNAPRGSPGADTRGGGSPAASASSSSRSHAPVDASAAACFAALVDASRASPPGEAHI